MVPALNDSLLQHNAQLTAYVGRLSAERQKLRVSIAKLQQKLSTLGPVADTHTQQVLLLIKLFYRHCYYCCLFCLYTVCLVNRISLHRRHFVMVGHVYEKMSSNILLFCAEWSRLALDKPVHAVILSIGHILGRPCFINPSTSPVSICCFGYYRNVVSLHVQNGVSAELHGAGILDSYAYKSCNVLLIKLLQLCDTSRSSPVLLHAHTFCCYDCEMRRLLVRLIVDEMWYVAGSA